MSSTQSTRRQVLQSGAAVVAAASLAHTAYAKAEGTIKVGLIGAGGRGTGAAAQQLEADPQTQIVAVADAFMDRAKAARDRLHKQYGAQRVAANDDTTFAGLDAYQKVLATDCDVVILATPPGFRPLHIEKAIDAGKHVFAEKPVAVDATGIRRVLAAGRKAQEKNLMLVSGLCWRYESHSMEMMKRLHDGAIGKPILLESTRYGGGVWTRPRAEGMTDTQYQTLNWYYFTWLSGDFIAEQFVHELDRMAWLLKDEYPTECLSTGGRISRTAPENGHIYDHFASQFHYASGAKFYATTRHQRGCDGAFTVTATGTEGECNLQSNTITGPQAWKPRGRSTPMHQAEQNAMYAALRAGTMINNTQYMAKSTLMAIMARDSAYTGKKITWEAAMNDKQDLVPDNLTWDTQLPAWQVAIPGKQGIIPGQAI